MKIINKRKKTIICLILGIIVLLVLMLATPLNAFAEDGSEVDVQPTPQPTPTPEQERGWVEDGIVGGIETIFLTLTLAMCGLIDLIIGLFKQLVGLEDVNIGDGKQNILTYFLQSEEIKNALLWITIIGFVLLFVFTTVQVVKGMQNSEDEKLHPKKTFESLFKASINIILVPIILVVLISTANIVMKQIDMAMTGGERNEKVGISYGGQIALMMATKNEDKLRLLDVPEWENYKTNGDAYYFTESGQLKAKISDNGKGDPFMGPNSIIKSDGKYPNFKYLDMNSWNADSGAIYGIKTQNLNIFVGFAGALALLFVLVMCSFTFVKRIFDVVLLYLVSPLMIATQPLDEGKRFSYWRDMAISKVLSAYGITIVINLYFMIVPIITINPGVTFFGGAENAIANGLVQLLFVIGGAFALNGANLLFSQLLGSGTMESQQGMGTAAAFGNMLRVGAGIGMAGLGLAKKVGGGTLKHGLGVALGGGGYLGRAALGSRYGQGIGAWANKIKGSKTLTPDAGGGSKLGEKLGDKSNAKNDNSNLSNINKDGGQGSSIAKKDLTKEQKRANKIEKRTGGGNFSETQSWNVARMVGRDIGGFAKGGLGKEFSNAKQNWQQMKKENVLTRNSQSRIN